MLEILSYPFMQRAIWATLLVGTLASFFSVFIVQRKMSFVGNGLAHASFGGVALALLIGVSPFWIATPFTILVALLFVWFSRNSKLESDSLIGVLFSVAMALGIIFLSWRSTYSQDAMSLLFGSILAVSEEDLLWSLGLLIVSLMTLPLWKHWAFSTFDRDLASIEKKNSSSHDYLLAIFIASTIVVAIKVFGIILLSAFLVIPAASARLVSRTFFGMTVKSILLGLGSSFAGIILSYFCDLPTGATIILVMGVVFGICFAASKLLTPVNR